MRLLRTITAATMALYDFRRLIYAIYAFADASHIRIDTHYFRVDVTCCK